MIINPSRISNTPFNVKKDIIRDNLTILNMITLQNQYASIIADTNYDSTIVMNYLGTMTAIYSPTILPSPNKDITVEIIAPLYSPDTTSITITYIDEDSIKQTITPTLSYGKISFVIQNSITEETKFYIQMYYF